VVLEEIVREELRPILEPLIRSAVRELVAEHVNGAAHAVEAPAEQPVIEGAETKQCVRCRQIKPANAFEKGRAVCRQCRQAAAREAKQRRQEPESESEGHSPGAIA
jgi:hypothetical protein